MYIQRAALGNGSWNLRGAESPAPHMENTKPVFGVSIHVSIRVRHISANGPNEVGSSDNCPSCLGGG